MEKPTEARVVGAEDLANDAREPEEVTAAEVEEQQRQRAELLDLNRICLDSEQNQPIVECLNV